MYWGGMKKGAAIRVIHNMVLTGHHPACQASLMSLVLEVPTVVRNIKKKNICKAVKDIPETAATWSYHHISLSYEPRDTRMYILT